MNIKLSKNTYYYIGIGYILLLLVSAFINNDILIKFNCVVLLGLGVILLLTNDKILLIITLVFSILSQFFVDELNFPQSVQYFPDILAAFILLKVIKKRISTKEKINNPIIKYIGVMLFFQIISFIANDYSSILFIWGCRNLYRFFIVFIGFQYLHEISNYNKVSKYLKLVVIIQLPISIYQTRIYTDWDNVSGLFGHKGTGLMLVYLMFICCFFVANYFHKKMNVLTLLVFIGIILVELILGSVRAAFFYIPAIVFIMYILSPVYNKNYKVKIRNITIVCIAIPLITIVSVSLFLNVFSTKAEFKGIEELFSFEYINDTANTGSYTSDGKSINRLSGVKIINDLVLDDNCKKVFGVGIGNAAPNKFAILQGVYYRKFSELNYNWFFVPYYVLENGFIGLSIYLVIIISLLVKSFKVYKFTDNLEEKILVFAYQGCVITILLTLIYNSSFNSPQVGYIFWAISGLVINLENKYTKLGDEINAKNSSGYKFKSSI